MSFLPRLSLLFLCRGTQSKRSNLNGIRNFVDLTRKFCAKMLNNLLIFPLYQSAKFETKSTTNASFFNHPAWREIVVMLKKVQREATLVLLFSLVTHSGHTHRERMNTNRARWKCEKCCLLLLRLWLGGGMSVKAYFHS